MNCKRAKELIITDYIDAEMDLTLKKELKAHLTACVGCREFEEKVLGAVREPFKHFQQVEPPADLWPKIKTAILAEKEKSSKVSLEKLLLRGISDIWFIFRKPAYAFVSIMAAVLIVMSLMKSRVSNENKEIRDCIVTQMEFVSYLGAEELKGLYSEFMDFGTAIEEYFL